MARTTARAICTLPGHGSSRRHEDRDSHRRPERRPPVGNQQASAAPTGYGLHPGGRTKITVRAFVSPMCHDHPEWTSNNRDTQAPGHTPMASGSWEGIPAQRHFRDARARAETGRRTPPRAGRKDEPKPRFGKPYARSGKNTCREDPEAFTAGNEKGQLNWPFTKSG